MTDDRAWATDARYARAHEGRIAGDPAGSDPDALATEYRQAPKLAGVAWGSIARSLSKA
jgi:hypothetical protein